LRKSKAGLAGHFIANSAMKENITPGMLPVAAACAQSRGRRCWPI
jgi:hypothetical protein